jgi:hypothetical protein
VNPLLEKFWIAAQEGSIQGRRTRHRR